MAKYLSGRSKRTPQSGLTPDRYQYLAVNQAEPNLGDPVLPGPTLPVGQQYQSVSIIGFPGERYWVPVGGGLIPGSISIYDEGVLTPAGGVSSITQLNFVGAAISAKGYQNLNGSPGVGVTITVFSPGTQGQVIFNNNNDFKGASALFYDNSTNYVGVGTILPTQELHINGDLRLTGTIYDYNNQPGNNAEILVKNNFGGVTWVNQSTIRAGAGGTITNIQYHNSAGLVDGAPNFVFDYINNRVGIGSTLPAYLFDVLGYSRFTGQTEIDYLRVTGVATISQLGVTNLTTTKDLQVTGFSTFTGFIDANGGAYIDNIQIGITSDNTIDTSTGNLTIGSNGGRTSITGITSVGFVTATTGFVGILTVNEINIDRTNLINLNVTGIATIATLGVGGGTTTRNLQVIGVSTIATLGVTGLTTTRNLQVIGVTTTNSLNVAGLTTTRNLIVTGVSTFGNIKISEFTVSTTSGNLILDSFAGTTQIVDSVWVRDETESTDTNTGSLYTDGGVGIDKNLNVGGQLSIAGVTTLASNGGITTTGGDLYVKGDLYVSDDIFYDELFARDGYFTGIVSTRNLNVTGVATIATLGVTGLTTTKNLIVTGVSTIATLGVTGLTTTKNLIVTGIATVDGLNINTTGIGQGDLGSNGGTDSIFGVYNTSIGGTISFFAKNSGGTYNSILSLTSSTSSINGNLVVSGIATFNGNVIFGDSTSDTVSFTSRVGTGITPSANGTQDLGGLNQKWNNLYVNTVNGNIIGYASSIAVQLDSTNTNRYIPFVDVTAGLTTVRTDDLFVFNPSTNSLGIGTTNPTDKLYVLDSLGQVATFESTSTSVALRLKNSTASNVYLFNKDDNNFVVRSGGTVGSETLRVTSTSVGIGTTVPRASLDVNGNVIPSINATSSTDANGKDLGGTTDYWRKVYAREFVGAITGNADTATYATSAGIATYATKAGIATYATDAGISTNLKGGVIGNIPYQSGANATTFLTNGASGTILKSNGVGSAPSWVDVTTGFTVAQSDTVKTISSTATILYPTFVDSNNTTAAYESVYTDAGITYNANTDSLTVTNLTASGNVDFGNATTDTVTFTARVDSDIIPSTTGLDLGSTTNKWDNLYVNNIIGNVTGAASSLSVTSDSANLDRRIVLSSVTSGISTVLADTNLLYNPSTNLLTVPNIKPTGIQDTSGGTGTNNFVLTANGTGGWTWKQASTSGGAAAIGGITIRDEGTLQGTASAVTSINFVGADVTATASGIGATITFTTTAAAAAGAAAGATAGATAGTNAAQPFATAAANSASAASGSATNAANSATNAANSATAAANSATAAQNAITNVSVTQTSYCTTSPITASNGTITIGTNSNAYGRRFVSTTEPTGTICNGDIWYDTSGGTTAGDVTITNGNLYLTTNNSASGDIIANGGTDGIFGIFNTTNSGTISLNAKNSVGTYINTLSLTSSTATLSGNLQFNSGYGSAAIAYGCRAWVNFNGTNIIGSGNISQVVNNSLGVYTIFFTNNMPDTNYTIVGLSGSYEYRHLSVLAINTNTFAVINSGTNVNRGNTALYIAVFR